jgi:hypothetical protein
MNFHTSEFGSNPFFTSSNFQQSQYVTNNIPIPSHPQQFPPTSTSNDFLKKIDEQLENSRKQYPS